MPKTKISLKKKKETSSKKPLSEKSVLLTTVTTECGKSKISSSTEPAHLSSLMTKIQRMPSTTSQLMTKVDMLNHKTNFP
jgi:hypothetical protein